MNPVEFATSFEVLTGYPPFAWQRRLYERYFRNGELPSGVDIPTGLGKTNVMAIWYLALRAGAPLPRRFVYVVDRRAVVDQATTIADKIKKKSCDEGLRVSTLRGQHVDKKEWLEDPAAPAIIVGTVDMIGSRLLFSGYGVSRRMRPYHAGLLGADTVVVLDESHLVPPFERLLKQISEQADLGPKCDAERQLIPRFRLLPLSATGRERDSGVFRLIEEDLKDPIVKQRLDANKLLTFKPLGNEMLEEELAAKAWHVAGDGKHAVRILVYCDSRETAEKTQAAIKKTSKKANIDIEAELFIGARRIKERVKAAETLNSLGFLAGSDVNCEKPAFVVATSAGEVGVDLDADHMVCDLVPYERMVQRLGRVNRLGKGKARVVVVDEVAKKLPETIKAHADRCRGLLQKLPAHSDGGYDASPGALVFLKDSLGQGAINAASTPEPLYPALNRPLVDAWSMTSLAEHTGRPEVQPWLRGWVKDDSQTTVVWRQYLPVRVGGDQASAQEVEDFFEAAPPHTSEKLESETWRIVAWLKQIDAQPPLPDDSTVAFALESAGRLRKRYRLAELGGGGQEKKFADRLNRELAGGVLIVDARLGGLTRDGLLDPTGERGPVSAADGENGWFDPSTGKPLAPFRVRREEVKRDDAEEPAAASEPSVSGENWHPVHAFDAERDGEGNAQGRLIIEKWRDENPNEHARSVARRAQTLNDHQDWVAKRAKELVAKLRMDDDIARAIVLAALLHDEGKKAPRWQNAFRTPSSDRPYAKTASTRPPDFLLLGDYRHEFGSLFHLKESNEFGVLPDDLKDLVRHLIAAHHGRARPVIETEDCDEGPPCMLQVHARDVALRFARLQKRFGPWGLAWLEALMRAADQRASRDLDEGRTPNG